MWVCGSGIWTNGERISGNHLVRQLVQEIPAKLQAHLCTIIILFFLQGAFCEISYSTWRWGSPCSFPSGRGGTNPLCLSTLTGPAIISLLIFITIQHLTLILCSGTALARDFILATCMGFDAFSVQLLYSQQNCCSCCHLGDEGEYSMIVADLEAWHKHCDQTIHLQHVNKIRRSLKEIRSDSGQWFLTWEPLI